MLAEVGLSGPESRRQVVVRGVRLNELIGQTFKVGEVECRGVEICEPCLHLQSFDAPRDHRRPAPPGGLNADVLSSGTISVGDAVELSD